MKIIQKAIDSIIPYARNPRKNDHAVDAVAASISQFGFKVPMILDKDNVVIAGHTRLKAARKLGLQEVPCIYADDLTPEQIKMFRLADNKVAELSFWDDELLAQELEEIADISDFDIEDFGFDKEELQDVGGQSISGTGELILKSCTLDELRPTEEERTALEGKRLLVGFSGGKDSSTAALWCRQFFPDAKMELCFADLGADYVGMELFLQEAAGALGGELKILRAKRNIIDVFLERKEWPHFMYPYCHDILHETLHGYWRQYDSSEVVIVLGRRLSEKTKTGKICENRFLEIQDMKGYQFFQPLYFADKEVGENLLIEAGIPLWEGYKYGLRRTACRCCPGQRPSAYAAIRNQYPEVWQEMLQLEKIMGTGYWRDTDKDKRSPLAQVADRGEAAFQEGDFPPRFKSDSL